jgi:hypothetical protein
METGHKIGMCILWWGTKKAGDDFQPETYELEVEFEIPDYKPNNHAYIQMMTYGVSYSRNYIFVNGNKIYPLIPHGDKWGFDAFLIHYKFLKTGKNKFKIISRNSTGGITGNIDDFVVRDPIIFYPVA